MSNLNHVLVEDFQHNLINLHNELGTATRNNTSKTETSYVELHEILDRYGIGDLKGTLVFDCKDAEEG